MATTPVPARSDPFPLSYFLYLGVLLWAPIPQASVSIVYSLLLTCLILFNGIVLICEAIYGKINLIALLKAYVVPLLLLTLAVIWIFIQIVPLDLGVLEHLAPVTAAYYRDMAQDAGAISVAPGNTAVRALFSLGLLIFFVLTIVLNQSAERMRRTLMVVVIAGTAQALYGSFMTLSGLEYGFLYKKEIFQGVATGTFIARNHLAGYLEMCLACGIGLLLGNLGKSESRNWSDRARSMLDTLLGPRIRLRIYLAFMVIALVLTRSRMGNTAFFSALSICGLLYVLCQQKFNWRAVALLASLMLVDVLIVGQWFGFEELVERMESTSAESETRDEAVADTFAMFQASPVAGYGLGTYYTAYLPFQNEAPVYYDHAHNDYLEFAAELGLIGIIPLGLLVLASAWMGASAMYYRRNTLAKGVGFAASMGILCLLIHSIVDFNLQMPANAMMFVFLLALGWMARQREWRSAR